MYPYVYTSTLQKNHPLIYKKFFAEYDMVLSLPHIFRFWHALGKWSSPLALRQKIPHQLFVWVNRTDRLGCHFVSMESFDLQKQNFLHGTPYEFVRNIGDIARACTTVMEQGNLSYGLEIGLLTEYPKWYGTSFNTVLCTLMALVLFAQEQKMPRDILKQYSFQHTYLFDDISLLGCYIKFLSMWSAWSCLPFVALQNQTVPVFQIGTVDFSQFSKNEYVWRLWNLSRLLEWKEWGKKSLWSYTLIREEKRKMHELPIDVAILHIGDSFESLREKEQALVSFSSDQRVDRASRRIEQQWISLSLDDSLLPTADVYGHMTSLLYTRLFYAAVQSLENGSEQTHLNEMIALLKDMGFYHCFVERQYDMISLLQSMFLEQRSFPEEMCAFLPMTTVKTGGTFLAVMPRRGEKWTLEKVVDNLQQTYGYHAKVLYANRKENRHDFGGARMHQYISEAVFSEYITPWTIQLTYADGSVRFDEYDAVLSDEALQGWITFDLIKRKILVWWQKVNHTVLCSQSATIEIILFLLWHLGEFVPNTHLPASAYSKHKNEMMSKILVPFQEIIHMLTGERLDIVCTWTLYDWTICLKKRPSCLQVIQYAHALW